MYRNETSQRQSFYLLFFLRQKAGNLLQISRLIKISELVYLHGI